MPAAVFFELGWTNANRSDVMRYVLAKSEDVQLDSTEYQEN